ncbi:2OG-Fe(II) oxygenase [Thalassolituus pacificus]|uniref:2OG-Fe(II) oxygenase n=1 Tax=Thalassolituus pacificus TaxID=2975440 RepID=A0A9X3AJE4_9GAMM|nr:2OG-Fe(II) oxygenase [Thalassolituus pacificus]MCT7360481.1 2OG-Fe(II) oxygenase [Thalassolituus pacificus]
MQLAETSHDDLFESLATDLQTQGYAITHDALPLLMSSGLLNRVVRLQHGDFTAAGTGRQQQHQLNQFVRRDKIRWLSNDDPAEAAWLDYMAELQRYMNRRLYLGLFSYEGHFAHYQPGDFYKKHMDAFKGQANRVLTTVLYLNPNWEVQDGGELVIYQAENHEQELLRVSPRFGTLVTFLSEDYPHEVLPAKRDRYSIAGWFRLNSSTPLRADPPR